MGYCTFPWHNSILSAHACIHSISQTCAGIIVNENTNYLWIKTTTCLIECAECVRTHPWYYCVYINIGCNSLITVNNCLPFFLLVALRCSVIMYMYLNNPLCITHFSIVWQKRCCFFGSWLLVHWVITHVTDDRLYTHTETNRVAGEPCCYTTLFNSSAADYTMKYSSMKNIQIDTSSIYNHLVV